MQAGTAIARAGAPAETLFVVRQGEVVILPPGNTTPVTTLGPGESFGVASLLADGTYEATAEAKTGALIYALPRHVVDAAIARHPELWTALEAEVASLPISTLLQRLPLLAPLPPDQVRLLAQRFAIRRYPAKETIFWEGDPGAAFYLVKTGTVRCDTDETEAERVMATWGPGDTFGAEALLSGKPHAYSVHCDTDVEILTLDGATFTRVVKEHRPLLEQMAQTLCERQLPRRIDRWSMAQQITAEGEVLYVVKDLDRGRYFKLSDRGAYLQPEPA